MTQLFDRSRRSIGNRPCWLGCYAVVPVLMVFPLPDGQGVEVETITPLGEWIRAELAVEELGWLLAAWKQSPEEAIEDYFKVKAPERNSLGQPSHGGSQDHQGTLVTEKSATELDL